MPHPRQHRIRPAAAAARQTLAPASGIVVRHTARQRRLDALEKEHERLLREIGKKRGSLATTRELAQDLMSELFARVGPLQQQFHLAAREVCRLFETLLGPKSRLSRRDQAKVRRAYATLLAGLQPESESDTGTSTEAPDTEWHSCSEQRTRESTGCGDSTYERPPFKEHPSAKDAHSSRGHKDVDGTLLRSLFRRLAIALHPDRVQCETEKAERTSIMKQVTCAYQSGDVARLVELDRSLLATEPTGDAPDTLMLRATRRLAENQELRQQLRQLTGEIKAVKQALPFRIDLRSPRAARGRAQHELDGLVEALEHELDDLIALREFVQRFVAGKVGLQEFLSGPPSATAIDSEEEAILAAILAFGGADIERGSRRRKAGGRGRTARSRKKP